MRRALILLPVALAARLLAACLPGDTRPIPAVVHFTVEPSAAVTSGVTTTDGWSVSFERLLVSIGDTGMRSPGAKTVTCEDYSGARYERLFDLTVPGQQKLSTVYALGSCALRVRLRTPSTDALLGEGVTAKDADFMRAEGTDAYETLTGTAVYVRGHATRAGVTKRFEWSFRRSHTLEDCARPGDAGLATDLTLSGGAALPINVVIHGEELFRESADPGAALRFDAIAAADADGDQMITLEELAKVPGPPLDMDAGLGPLDGGASTLADLVYEALVPQMVRLSDSEACKFDEPRPSD